MVKTTLRVPEPIWKAARMRAIEEHRTFQDVLADALDLYLRTPVKKTQRQRGRT